MWGLIGLLSGGTMRMLDLHGPALYRGEAKIRAMRFARDIDPEDCQSRVFRARRRESSG
jgi:hypothetical protein